MTFQDCFKQLQNLLYQLKLERLFYIVFQIIISVRQNTYSTILTSYIVQLHWTDWILTMKNSQWQIWFLTKIISIATTTLPISHTFWTYKVLQPSEISQTWALFATPFITLSKKHRICSHIYALVTKVSKFNLNSMKESFYS